MLCLRHRALLRRTHSIIRRQSSSTPSPTPPTSHPWLSRLPILGATTPAPPEKQNTLHLRRLFGLVLPERRLMSLALSAQLVSAGASMFFPLALGRIVDTVQLPSGGGSELDAIALGLGVVFTVAGASTVVRVSSLSLVGGRISRDLRKRLFSAVLSQDTAFFDTRQSGELVNRLSNDVAAVSRTLTDNTARLVRCAVTGTSSLAALLYISPGLTFVAIAFFPPMAAFGAVFGRVARRLSRELVDAYAAANQAASERIGAIRTVRVFGAEAFEAVRYASRVDATFGLGRKVAFADGIFAGGMFYAAQMSLLGVLYVGGGMVLDPAGGLTVGNLTSFSMYAVQLGVSVSGAGTSYGQLLKALGSGTRVFEVLDREPVTQTSTLVMPERKRGGWFEKVDDERRIVRSSVLPSKILAPGYDAVVRFEDVHFKYDIPPVVARREVPGNDDEGEEGQGEQEREFARKESEKREASAVTVGDAPMLLRGVDFSFSPGQVCAVAGESGSGKSSLMSLLSRLYLPDRGCLRLDGVDMAELDLNWLRSQVAVVPQEPILFSGSIARNIAYAMPGDVEMSDIHAAARAAGSHDMIMSLRDGYETEVGERGQGLSGGQKQRISISRALIRKPRVLLLDEATASLDSGSEAAVAEAIAAAASRSQAAVLVIAHRLSSLRRADNVVVLANGRIAERGTFSDLVSRQGSYLRRMVKAGGGYAGAPRPTEHLRAKAMQ